MRNEDRTVGNRMLRFALVAVLTMVFGVAGLVSSAEAVTYYLQGDTTTNLGFDGNANLPITQTTGIATPYRGTAVTTPANPISWRPTTLPSGAKGLLRGYTTTNYASSVTLSAISGSATIRSTATTDVYTLDLYDYNPVTGTKTKITSSNSVTGISTTANATAVFNTYTPSSATIASGHRLMFELAATTLAGGATPRYYYGGTTATTGTYVTVTETFCSQTINSSITANATTTASSNFNGASLFTLADIINAQYRVTGMSAAGTDTISNHTAWAQVVSGAATGSYPAANIANGSNRMLVVAYGAEAGATISFATATGTYGGQNMTRVVSSSGSAATRRHTVLFICNDACISAAVAANNRVITIVPGATVTTADQAIHAAVYQGVNQTTPYTNTLGIGFDYGGGTAANISAADNGGVVVETGGMYIYSEISTTTNQNFAAIAGFTEALQTNTASAAVATGYRNTTTAATITTSSTNTSVNGAISAMALRPAPLPATETELIAWNVDPQEASAVLTNGNTYTIYAKGTDASDACNTATIYAGGTADPGTGKSFTWTSCTETATVAITNPGVITAPTAITVTGGTNPEWSVNGGINWYASGTIYTPTSCGTGAVNIIGRATGSCGTVTATPVNTTFDTTDKDLATLTITGPASPVSGIKTVAVQVGTETTPSSLTNVYVNVAGSSTCNVSNAAMSWNGASSRWEYSWDTSACGVAAVQAGVTINVSANDPDCNNTVNAAQSTVTIDNTCTDAVSTVYWTPPGATMTSPTVVTATVTGSATGAQVSFDNGTSWVANGSTYTPALDSVGTVDIKVRALNGCGLWIYSTTYTVAYDGRVPAIKPLTVSAVQSTTTSIRVTMVYCSDLNNNALTTVRYKLTTAPDLPASWTTAAAVIDGGAGDVDGTLNEYVVISLNGLASDVSYNVELTVADTDGVNQSSLTLPWTGIVSLASWVDNPLLHNALRFACSTIGYADEASCAANGGTWNLNRKWTGGWGISETEYPGNQYGAIGCGTCHIKDSSNIKRFNTTVIAASTGTFPGSVVDYQSRVEGSSDLGNDLGTHATSTKACEVCHSKTTYHRFNTDGQSNLVHNNQSDCIRCHEHNVGFRASCDSCHGTPPVSAQGLVTVTNGTSVPTGSVTYGEHQKHSVILGYDCKTCHNGWDNTNQMPNSGNVNLGYKVSTNPSFAGAANAVDGGTYNGRILPGGKYFADTTTSPVTTVTNTGATTCAVYCHGASRPVWNPTSTAACGSCHGAIGSGIGDRAGAPTGVGSSVDLAGSLTGYKVGKHAKHIVASFSQTGDPCALCHDGFGYSAATHVNGTVNVKLRQVAKIEGSGTTGGAGVSATFTPGVGAKGTCANMDCHGTTFWDSAEQLNCTQSCHNYPPVGVTAGYSTYNGGLIQAVTHNTPNGTTYLKDNHGGCKYCHGWNDNGSGSLPISGMTAAEITAMKGDPAEASHFTTYNVDTNPTGHHMDGNITMNGDSNANGLDDAAYDPTTGGCDNAVCHGNDAEHQFTAVGTGTTNTITPSDIGPGDCGACHTTGVGGATVVTPTSPHTLVLKGGTFTGCGSCHSGHYVSAGGVQIPNNSAVGINYLGAAHGGIKLGGPGTDASISGKTNEAEICWGCHDLAANLVSEWGVNNKQAGSPVPTQYNYGTVGAGSSKWMVSGVAATWTSGRATEFAYKTGKIQSTHAANTAGTTAVTGANYAKFESIDAVQNIRCSYCHDVHDAVGPSGKPYLRGTWWSNPYEEDGAPQSTWTPANVTRYGAVPRGNGAAGTYLGGFYIDINNKQPGTSTTTANGTAYVNPTASGGTGTAGAWTVSDSAGLCTLCHGSDVNALDQTTGEALWLGVGATPNGHANAVIGGSGNVAAYAANIFTLRGGATGNVSNPLMHFTTVTTDPGRSATLLGYRNTCSSALKYQPPLSPLVSSRTPTTTNNWGTMTFDDTTINSQYHKFSCSKCHNPHASRLPKLMITNCLDTKHNTWDDAFQLNTGVNTASNSYNRSVSNWASAQNCHRRSGIANGSVEPVDAGAVAAPDVLGNQGWNRVTPWTTKPL